MTETFLRRLLAVLLIPLLANHVKLTKAPRYPLKLLVRATLGIS